MEKTKNSSETTSSQHQQTIMPNGKQSTAAPGTNTAEIIDSYSMMNNDWQKTIATLNRAKPHTDAYEIAYNRLWNIFIS